MPPRICKACGSITGSSRPTHVHSCNAGDEPHTWPCDSAYCGDRNRDCTEHGGEKPRSE